MQSMYATIRSVKHSEEVAESSINVNQFYQPKQSYI